MSAVTPAPPESHQSLDPPPGSPPHPDPAPRTDPRPAPRHRRAPVRIGPLPLVAAFAVTLVWLAVVLTARQIEAGPTVHRLALFGHLAALVVGFGPVLTVDWLGLQWMLGRIDLLAVLRTASDAHLLIWLGLIGLAGSGVLLAPDTSATLTRIKLAAVLVVALNGLYVGRMQQQLAAYADRPAPWRLLARGGAAALTSQACWWTATAVGFLSAQR
jgi:hypothetical protein